MLASIFLQDINYWNINDLLREDDVEIEDEDQDEDEEDEEYSGIHKSATPDLDAEIYRDEDETPSIAECF